MFFLFVTMREVEDVFVLFVTMREVEDVFVCYHERSGGCFFVLLP